MGKYDTRMAWIIEECVTYIDGDEEGKNKIFQGLHHLKFLVHMNLEFQRF